MLFRSVGHGLGMSQYTANEMAKEGHDASAILEYFFEGTELKEVAEIVRSGAEQETDAEGDGDTEEKVDENSGEKAEGSE